MSTDRHQHHDHTTRLDDAEGHDWSRHDPSRHAETADDGVAMAFTPRGMRALDALADALVNRMAATPEGIARVLDEVLHAPLADLCGALDVVAAGRGERVSADRPARGGVVYADGWREQLPGRWPYRPDEPHHCHQQAHWTRDGRLVLACCGLDAT